MLTFRNVATALLVLVVAAAIITTSGCGPKSMNGEKVVDARMDPEYQGFIQGSKSKETKTPVILVNLRQGKDGLWVIDKGGYFGRPTAVVISYTTSGQQNPTGAAYDCRVFCEYLIVDEFGDKFSPKIMLGLLENRGPGVHVQRFPLNPRSEGDPKAIGLHQVQPGNIMGVKLELLESDNLANEDEAC